MKKLRRVAARAFEIIVLLLVSTVLFFLSLFDGGLRINVLAKGVIETYQRALRNP